MQSDLEARGVGYDRPIEPPTAGALMAQPAFTTVTITRVMPSQSAHLCTSQWATTPLHIQLFDTVDVDTSIRPSPIAIRTLRASRWSDRKITFQIIS